MQVPLLPVRVIFGLSPTDLVSPLPLGCPTYRCWTGCPLARALLTQHCPGTSEHPVHVAMRGRADQRIRLALPSSHCTLCNAWASLLQQLTLPARFRSLAWARVSGFSRPPWCGGEGEDFPQNESKDSKAGGRYLVH